MNDHERLPPILCAPLIPAVDAKLIEVLRSLQANEWEVPTIVPGWQVRDVAAHLLTRRCESWLSSATRGE
jgi:hypothetical protein